jgi:hypothetical protein
VADVVDRWTAPMQDWHKTNWDAALDAVNGRLGLGMVVQDIMGRVVVAKCLMVLGHLDPTILRL